jgi:N-formylglutamate deformylase
MEPYRYFPGTIPLLISVPHCGTFVPESILARLTPEAKQLPDTDWHVDRLYDFVRGMGAHLLVATHSRYVVDLNRAPDDTSLYPGKFTTGLVPTMRFDGSPLYVGAAPDAAEVAARVEQYWKPYHACITQWISEQSGVRTKCVFDVHSIASRVPLLFEGQLPDLNFGTADGASASAELTARVMEVAERSAYSAVLNGRFKGGYITRQYGNPAAGIQTIQLELSQVNYMQEQYPFAYDDAKAASLQEVLRAVVAVVAQEIS